MDNCTIDCIQIYGNYTYEKTCNFVQDQCQQSSVQFIQAYFCTLHESFFLLVVFGIILFTLFYLALNALTQNCLTPSVQNVIVRFKISPTLAGITFLAFANGAPDVLTAILAGGSSSSSTVLIPFGSIFGGSLFSTAFVLSAVIFQSPNQRFVVKIQQILVPLGFYIFGMAFLMLVSITYGKMNIYLALVLIIAYIIFISFILKTQKKRRKQHIQSLNDNKNKIQDQIITDAQKTIQSSLGVKKQRVQSQSMKSIAIQQQNSPKNYQEPEQQNILMKIINKISQFYAIVLLWIIPPRDNTQWSPFRSLFSIVLSPFVLALSQDIQQCFQSTILGIPFIVYLTLPAILFTVHIFICWYKNWKPIQLAFYTIYSFLVTIAWLTLVVGVLINLLELIQLLTNINSVFLGLTLISWANTIGDYLSITAFAKKGRASTAVSGVFSGQLFNFLIGFGSSLLIQSSEGEYQFDIFSFDGSTYDILSDSIVVFIITASIIYFCLMFYKVISLKGILHHKDGVIFRGYYVVVLLIALILSISTDFFQDIQCDLSL